MALVCACLVGLGGTLVGSAQGALPEVAPARCPGGTSCLIVTIVGGDQRPRTVFVTNKELRSPPRQDLGTTQYQTRKVPGGPLLQNPLLFGATSIRSLIRNLPLDREQVRSVVVRNPADGRFSALRPADLRDPGSNGFQGGLEPAFEATTTDDLNYMRPLREGDSNDVNGGEYLATRQGQPLEVTVVIEGEQRVGVTIDATPDPATEAEAVAFTSTVERPGSYAYAWDFGDGGTSTEADPSHTFDQAGTYAVSLTVSGEASGQSEVLLLRAREKKPPKTEEPPECTKPGGCDGQLPGLEEQDGGGTGESKDPNAPEPGPDENSGGLTGGAKPGPRPDAPGAPEAQPGDTPDPTEQDDQGRRTPGAGEVRGVLLAGGQAVPVGVTLDAAPADAGEEPTAPTARASALGADGGGLWWGAGALPLLLLLGAVGETGLLATLGTRLSRLRPTRKGRET